MFTPWNEFDFFKKLILGRNKDKTKSQKVSESQKARKSESQNFLHCAKTTQDMMTKPL